MNHCVYCGEAIPPELKQGFQEPEALRWVDRPTLPAEASRKLEMMKVVPLETRKSAPNFVVVAGIVSIPIFAVIFYLTYTMLRQLSPTSGFLILLAGVAVVGYLVSVFVKASRNKVNRTGSAAARRP